MYKLCLHFKNLSITWLNGIFNLRNFHYFLPPYKRNLQDKVFTVVSKKIILLLKYICTFHLSPIFSSVYITKTEDRVWCKELEEDDALTNQQQMKSWKAELATYHNNGISALAKSPWNSLIQKISLRMSRFNPSQ